MTQTVVIKVAVKEHKSRSKALKVVVGVPGVESASLAGQDKNRIVVTGVGIDVVALMRLLKKKVGSAELLSVGQAEYGGHGNGMVHIPVGSYNSYPTAYGQGYGNETRNNPYAYGPSYGYGAGYGSYAYGPGHWYETGNQNPDNCSIL